MTDKKDESNDWPALKGHSSSSLWSSPISRAVT